jgi:predicted RNase H-like HicB family nuclease
MKYQVVLSESDEGFAVSCPGLPGCWSEGATDAEALQNVADAIRDYLEVAAELARESKSIVREVDIPFKD